jgi:hypothetical protein
MRWFAILALAVLVPGPGVFAGGAADSFYNTADNHERTIRNYAEFPGAAGVEDMPVLVEEGGKLVLKPGALKLTGISRVSLPQSRALWAVRQPPNAALIYFDRGEVDGRGFYFITCTSTAATTSITAYGGLASGLQRVTVTRTNTTFRVQIAEMNEVGATTGQRTIFNGPAGSDIGDFRRDSPQDYARYLAPALEILSLKSLWKLLPGDAYRVFTEIQPPADMRREVARIVLQLATADADLRAELEKRLAALGRPGILAAVRLDRSLLVPEAALRLDSILRANLSRTDDPVALRANPFFLVCCLEDEDAEVRRLALAALRAATGKDIAFDLDAPAEVRQKAAQALLAQLLRN